MKWQRSSCISCRLLAMIIPRSSVTIAAHGSRTGWRSTIHTRSPDWLCSSIVPTIEEFERMSGGPSLLGVLALVPAGPTRACPRRGTGAQLALLARFLLGD